MNQAVAAVPSVVSDRYKQLCQLCSKSENGTLSAKDVAEYMGVSYQWLLNYIYTGQCPFALGEKRGKARGTTNIDVLKVYNYFAPKEAGNILVYTNMEARQ